MLDCLTEEEDTNDEMTHPLVDRQSNKRGKVASSALSMEEALEIALSLAKVARNKKQETRNKRRNLVLRRGRKCAQLRSLNT